LTIIGKKEASTYYDPETNPSESGTCGSAERTYLAEEVGFTGEFCSIGEVASPPNFPSPGNSASWSCQENELATSCSAYRQKEEEEDLEGYEEVEEEPQSPPQSPPDPPKSDSNQGLSTFLTNDDVAVAGATTETLENVSLSLATTFIALALAQILLQTSSITQLPLVVFNLFSVPAYKKKKIQSGVAYDSQTGQPIPLAQVTIYNLQGKALETKSTDKYGSYFFLVPKGKYQLKIHKQGYQQISEDQKERLKVTYQDNYFQGQIIDSKQEDFINPSIPLRATSKSLASSMINQKFIHQIFQVLFYLGFALALAVIFLEPTFFNSLVLLSYLFFFFLKTVNFSRPNWGVISQKNRPQPFAMVSINTKNHQTPLARAITNQSGHYAFILDKGSYQIQAQDNQGKQVSSSFHQPKRSITGLDLNLK